MKISKALYGTAVLLLSFLPNSMNLAAQAQLLPPPLPIFQANNDFATTNEDTPTTINVLANDQGSETGLFSVRSVTKPSNGAAVISSSNTITYTPNANFFGSDSFQYTASDATGLVQSTASVFVTINSVNDPPVANAQSVTTNEDTAVTITLTGSDVDGNSLTFFTVTAPTNGALGTIGAVTCAGTIPNTCSAPVIYTPNPNFNGADSFTFKVTDPSLANSAPATISITISAVNDAPVASPDTYSTNEDTTLTVAAPGVLGNDIDVDGNPLTAVLVSGPSSGSLTLNSNGGFTYAPDANFNGIVTFTYQTNDGALNSNVATVTITVTPVNDPPVTNNQAVSTPEDTPVAITLTGSDVDGDALTFTIVSGPSNGVLSGTAPSLTYTPNTNFNGADSFTFTVSDGIATSTAATVSMTVNPVNDPPVANADSATTNEDTAIDINVLANDSDVDGDTLTVTLVTTPLHGTAVINVNQTIHYTPNANFNGADSFTYTISDGHGGNATGTVSMTVNPVNDAPVANNDLATTKEDTSVSINVLTNDSDVDGDPLLVISLTQGINGRTELFSNGAVIYTPNRDFNGQDSFTYTISDGNGGTATATVNVTVIPVPDFVISKKSSGWVASDPLTQPKTKEQLQADSTDLWTFGGSATAQNAPVDFFQDAQGLHVGVQAVSSGTWAGYFAVTPNTDAFLWHAVVTTPVRTIPGNFFQNALYVQTSNGLINYVTCVSSTSTAGTTWHVAHATGNTTFATVVNILWSDTTPNQPLTKDCTIITNGNNYLKVYLDNVLVYQNNQLDLKMPPPFNAFLEPQNSHAAMLYGIYKDFYAVLDENIKVINAPSTAARVDVVDSSGNVFASAPVSNGTAILDVGKYHFPLAAHIKVYDSSSAEIVSTTTPASIAGGDVYSVDQQTLPTMQILVVPYFVPASPEWNTIYQQADLHPGTIKYAIINPCNGPCIDALSADWQDIINKLRSRGIKTLGYLFNNSQSITNIDYYMKAPAVRTDGIFFDHEGSTDNIANFKQYADYVHSLNGIVYINPGFNYTHVISYIAQGLADVANLYENGVEKSNLIPSNCNIPPSRVSIILGNTSTASDMRIAIEETASKGIGITYLYGNSYNTLPSYFAEMVKTASTTRVNEFPNNCTP